MPEGLWPVDIDRGQMSQVFQNLLINAKDAMLSGGVVSDVCEEMLNLPGYRAVIVREGNNAV